MTYGLWISRARARLGEAAEHLASAPTGSDLDVLALMAGRGAVYRQLERNVEMLLARTTGIGRAWRGAPETVMPVINRFREWLAVTAADRPGMPKAPSELPAVAALTEAGDYLGLAADSLASHPLPEPRTPEGVAIRLGGGVPPALAELARVGIDAVAVDRSLSAWLTAAPRPTAIAEWAIGPAVQATTGSLPQVLQDVTDMALTGPRLLDELELAPAMAIAPPAVNTPTAAAAGLRAVRTWLWQHPNRVHAAHLRLGTQIGLAVHLLAGDYAGPSTVRAWRRAVGFADEIEGSPPADDAAQAAHRLSDVLGWARTAIDRDDATRVDEPLAELPRLADSLVVGVRAAIARGDIFVNRSRLERARGGVVRAKTVWLRPEPKAGEIIGLLNALAAVGTANAVQQPPSPARAAFKRPPQAGTAGTPAAHLSTVTSTVLRRPSRR